MTSSTNIFASSSATTLSAFAAGLITALVILLLTSRRDAVTRLTRLSARATGRALVRLRTRIDPGTRKVIQMEAHDDEVKEPAVDNDSINARDSKEAKGQGGAVVPGGQKKPFEFRKRLRYEPPSDDEPGEGWFYEKFECFDTVQKEFKDAGGKDLAWKSSWLDKYTEWGLLRHYQMWADRQRTMHDCPEKDDTFYAALVNDLRSDVFEVEVEYRQELERFGKSSEEEINLLYFMNTIRERECQK